MSRLRYQTNFCRLRFAWGRPSWCFLQCCRVLADNKSSPQNPGETSVDEASTTEEAICQTRVRGMGEEFNKTCLRFFLAFFFCLFKTCWLFVLSTSPAALSSDGPGSHCIRWMEERLALAPTSSSSDDSSVRKSLLIVHVR